MVHVEVERVCGVGEGWWGEVGGKRGNMGRRSVWMCVCRWGGVGGCVWCWWRNGELICWSEELMQSRSLKKVHWLIQSCISVVH